MTRSQAFVAATVVHIATLRKQEAITDEQFASLYHRALQAGTTADRAHLVQILREVMDDATGTAITNLVVMGTQKPADC